MAARRHPSEPKHEAFFQQMCADMKRHCDLHPELKNIDVIAVLGRLTGYCIAMAFPDERDLARATAIANMDHGTADVAQPGPTRPGVNQT